MDANSLKKFEKRWLFFIYLYLFIDYGRPQDIIPIGFLKPGMIVTVILMVFLLFSGKLFQVKNTQVKVLLIFIFLLMIHVPFAANNFYAYRTFKAMFLYLPFILSVVICINSVERLRKFLLFSVGLMMYVAVFSYIHKGVGSGSYFHDENDVSLFINMWLPFCYFLFVAEKRKLIKIFYIFVLIFGVLTVVVSFSRGGFVGLAVVLFIIWLFSPRKIVSLFAVAVIVLILLLFGSQAYWQEMSTVTDTSESTATARFFYWDAAWKMFLDHPIIGVGGDNFQVRFPEYQSEWFQRDMWGVVAHSLWFTLISELGILGLITYLLLLFYNLKDIFLLKKLKNYRKNEDLRYLYYVALAFFGSLAGYFVSATFLSVLYYAHYWYICGIIMASVTIMKKILPVKNLKTLKAIK